MLGWLSPNGSGYISKSHVYWIGGFAPRELGKLGLICGDYYWSKGGSFGKVALDMDDGK